MSSSADTCKASSIEHASMVLVICSPAPAEGHERSAGSNITYRLPEILQARPLSTPSRSRRRAQHPVPNTAALDRFLNDFSSVSDEKKRTSPMHPGSFSNRPPLCNQKYHQIEVNRRADLDTLAASPPSMSQATAPTVSCKPPACTSPGE
jgi:hypothetical protein